MNKQLFLKLLSLGLLAMILALALSNIELKVNERSVTRDGAVRAIADQYAREQQLVGPLMLVKCSETVTNIETDIKGVKHKNQSTQDCTFTVRPSTLQASGDLNVNERYRGIYKAHVYLANLQLRASFSADKFQLKPNQVINQAYLVLGVSDPRGLKAIQVRDNSNRTLPALPGVPDTYFNQGFHVEIAPNALKQDLALEATIELAGSTRLDLVPIGENNEFKLKSTWRHPSFSGNFLPEKRDVSQQGFHALWRINDFATGGERMLDVKSRTMAEGQAPWLSTTLGVALIDPVNAYTQTDRAVRYGFLFVLLTLGSFFLFEVLKSRTVHPLQYLLVGFAVVLFFLLLLALSEHLAFRLAYEIAAAACVLMIAAYGRTLLGSWKNSATLGIIYSLLYLGLYQLLASEDYALLLGSWLVFGILALTMYLTRRLDWGMTGKRLPENALDAQPNKHQP